MATSRTGFTCKPGSPRRCICFSTGTWESIGPGAATARDLGRHQTVDDAELWETQQVLKARLINFVRNRLVVQARRRNEPDAAIQKAMEALDLNALTIGFARRFATYKRAGLIFAGRRAAARDGQRDRPADPDHLRRQGPSRGPDGQGVDPGHRADDPAGAVRNRIVFVEDYDMNVARSLVQGVDVWLNNPAASAGGQRHLRSEGGAQRHAQLLDSRRLVGRGV